MNPHGPAPPRQGPVAEYPRSRMPLGENPLPTQDLGVCRRPHQNLERWRQGVG